MLKRFTPLNLFLITFVLMFYGRLSVVMFIPQYAIDYNIPSQYYSLYFSTICVGSAVSNLLCIILLRHVNPKRLFLGIGFVSAAYEILLYLFPTPEVLLISGLLIGLAAGIFWTLTFLMICELIDKYQLSSTDAFSRYNVITTVMSALTPLIAGIIVQSMGYGIWLISALGFLIASTVIMFFLNDPIYYKTYGKYPIKEDLSKVLADKRTLITFLLTMLFTTLTINTWSSVSKVFYANVGIRNVWLGLLSLVVSTVTIVIYWLLAKKRFTTRKMLVTLGILIFGIELFLITLTSDTLLVFLLEGIVGATGVAIIGFSTQNILKNTFRERTYIGRPIFALGMNAVNAVWFAACGYIIAYFGGFEAVGQILGITVDQFGFRVLLLIMTALVVAWAVSMWKYEELMVED